MFWSKASWTSRDKSLSTLKGKQGKSLAAEGINVKMLYVVNKEGNPIDGYRATAIRTVARGIWSQLSNAGLAPSTWTDASLPITDHFRHEMQTRCEELRLCEAGWKADQIAYDNYSHWRASRKRKGVLNVTVKKEDDDDSDEEDGEDKGDDEKENAKPVAHSKRKQEANETHPVKKHKRAKSLTPDADNTNDQRTGVAIKVSLMQVHWICFYQMNLQINNPL